MREVHNDGMIPPCRHRETERICPISKTPCLGECTYSDILDDIGLGIIGLDIRQQQVFFQNKLAIEIFRDSIKPKDYDALVSLLLPHIEIPLTAPNVREARTLQYGSRFIGYSVYAISDTYLWIYVTDITEKMRLGAIAEAVNTMNNLGYIFAGIRHELGNPINSIKTSMAVCKKNLQNYSKEMINEFIDRVLSDITRVEDLLRDLKNFSMYEHPECREVHIASFINNLIAMVNRDFIGSNIRIRTLLRPGADFGYFDTRALQHVLLNVLTNAFDALKNIPAPEIIISVVPSNDRFYIKVRDNGCGIPEDQKKRLFQPFSTTKGHGTGLGLVIIRKMMLKMGGTVEVESSEGTGTTVILTLPSQCPDNA